MTDLPDWSSSVNIQAGSVTITAGSLVLNYPAGTPIDPRSIRALTTTDQVAAGNLPAGLLNTQQPQSQPSGSPMTFLHNATSSATFTVPSGTHAISFLFVPNIGIVSGKLSNIAVKGITSGASYKSIGEWDLFSTNQGQLLVVPIDSAVDSQISIQAGWTDPTIDVKCYVAAILDTTAVYVGNSIYDPISVEYTTPQAPNGSANPVTVIGTGSRSGNAAVGTVTGDYDGLASSAPASGTKATISLAANTTQRWRCQAYHFDLRQAGATASGTAPVLRDGATGAGTILCPHGMGVDATAGHSDQRSKTGVAYRGSINTAMTAEFDAAAATSFEALSIAAYLQP